MSPAMRAVATPLGCLVCGLLVASGAQAGEARYANLPGGAFTSALKYEDTGSSVRLPRFSLMSLPVTNADFLAFVTQHPKWQRDRVASVFAETRYLSHWASATRLGPQALPAQPVVWVSWFAANAYCQAQGARLPSWSQWEYAAAADEKRVDARRDPAWRERILAWYATSSKHALPSVGRQPANAYGLRDLHGLVWEWTDDFSALLVSGDNRDQVPGPAQILRCRRAGDCRPRQLRGADAGGAAVVAGQRRRHRQPRFSLCPLRTKPPCVQPASR